MRSGVGTKLQPGLGIKEAEKLMVEDFVSVFSTREKYIEQFGFVLLTREVLITLANQLQGKKVVDVGAGSGYLSAELEKRGVDIIASDMGGMECLQYRIRRVIKRDHEGDSLRLLPGNYDAVIMCWPHGSFAARVITMMKSGQTLIYEGEGQGGCTANDDFFDILDKRWRAQDRQTKELNKRHVQFSGIHDYWDVFVKM
jgi:hypothetical protein